MCRTSYPLDNDIINKLALFCNIPVEAVIANPDIPTLYEIPLVLEKQGLTKVVLKKLNLPDYRPDLDEWKAMVEKTKNLKSELTVGLVGKYVALHDAYLSTVEALKHAGIANDSKINIKWINSELLTEENVDETLGEVDAILVPAGFGDRGINGKILACQYAREHDVPFFGIGLGMQLSVVEYARNVLGLKAAHSTEVDPGTVYPVIDIMPDQKDTEKTGTMRLGKYPCHIMRNTKVYEAYQKEIIDERHRQRYEVNNAYRDRLEEAGMYFVGKSPDGKLCEILEVADKRWFVGVQFHPEFKSRPNRPHPLFRDYVKAALEYKKEK